MRFNATVFPVSYGQYGPFSDGRTIDFVTVAPSGGEEGDVEKVTLAQGVRKEDIPLRQDCKLQMEVYRTEKGLRLRTHGVTKA